MTIPEAMELLQPPIRWDNQDQLAAARFIADADAASEAIGNCNHRPCTYCDGTGLQITSPCEYCGGDGTDSRCQCFRGIPDEAVIAARRRIGGER